MIALLFAAALGATNPAATPQTATAPAAKPVRDPDKVICRVEDEVGSHFQHKVCRTRAEWQAQDQARDRFMRDASNQAAVNPAVQGTISTTAPGF